MSDGISILDGPHTRQRLSLHRLRVRIVHDIPAVYCALALPQRIKLPLDQGIQLLFALIARFERNERPLLIARA